MNIKVLGCSGGVGSIDKGEAENGSTCLLIDDNILIDAGSGLGRLDLEQMRNIKHVLLTHSHMDHICYLPTFLGNLFDHIDEPVIVYALPETIEVLQDCIFNWQIWPDFTKLPTEAEPIMRFVAVEPWQSIQFGDLTITPFFVEHTVPTVGYSVKDHREHFVFAADTTASDVLNDQLDRLGHINTLMIECAFPEAKSELAIQSRHMTPSMIQETLDALAETPDNIWITHLKPAYDNEIRHDIRINPDYHHWRVL